ncbi:MAG: deoxyguanosinetriphosphate triphosphohydrolase [Actinomycetaceae bacterium]|nr:deoxyguanosinetriphosphate triphosphohydrolase [Actinomycetaceae bacterium]
MPDLPDSIPNLAYGQVSHERRVEERHKPGSRTNFERDRARVLHSAALRRLGAKTQVLRPSYQDFIRTRLTHSLEVAQVGRELGKALGCNPDVVDAACLSHDLGHPPFGHNGERILARIAAGIGGFEGNAQTLRLLARLEPKVVDTDGRPAGLNLTRAALDATVKYPWTRYKGPEAGGSEKFGVYEDDLEILSWMRGDVLELDSDKRYKRCIEAQVMDLSDDIGYSVHDVEDAIQMGVLDPKSLDPQSSLMADVLATTRKWYKTTWSDKELLEAFSRLASLDSWLGSFTGTYGDLAALKDMTSQLIGRFVEAAHNATREVYGPGRLTRYSADLVIPETTWQEITVLKGLAVHFVMAPREKTVDHFNQQDTLNDLVGVLLEAQESGEHALEEPFAALWSQAGAGAGDLQTDRDAGRLRAVIDQVASLTDVSAQRWHARWCGVLRARPV